MHLKLPPETPLGEAGAVAAEVDAAVTRDIPQVSRVRTHLEPLETERDAEELADARDADAGVRDVVMAVCGMPPHDVRLVGTADGVVAFITLALGDAVTLEEAHDTGGAVRRRIRDEVPGVVDAFVEARP